jgi:hypothetical protein
VTPVFVSQPGKPLPFEVRERADHCQDVADLASLSGARKDLCQVNDVRPAKAREDLMVTINLVAKRIRAYEEFLGEGNGD